MNKHSPGPWTVVEDHNGTRIEDAQRYGIMSETYAGDYSGRAYPTIKEEADARLIAAAPDLLAALEGLVDVLEEIETYGYAPNSNEALNKAIAAFAKAKGE